MALTLGNEYIFSSGTTECSVVKPLDSTRCVVVWSDASDADKIKARIATLDGTEVSFGDTLEIVDGEGAIYGCGWKYPCNVAVTSSSGFLIGYGNGTQAYGVACSVSGTTISKGTAHNIHVAKYNQVDVATLSADKVLAFTYGTDNNLYAHVVTINGLTVTDGGSNLVASLHNYPRITTLSSSGAIAVGRDWAGVDKWRCRHLTINGDTVTAGAAAQGGSCQFGEGVSVQALASDKFALCYHDIDDADKGKVQIGTVSGTTITLGTAAKFIDSGINSPELMCDDQNNPDSFRIVCEDYGDSNYGKWISGEVSGTTPTFDSVEVFHSGTTNLPRSTMTEAGASVIVYTDASNSNYGTMRVSPGAEASTEFSASGDLFIHGCDISQASGDLYICSAEILTASGNLFTRGATTVSDGAIVPGQAFDWLEKTSDYDPHIIGSFDNQATVVNIQVWDVTNGANTALSVSSSGCYQIGNTNYWGWSTEYLPTHYSGHLYYQMTSDAGEDIGGQIMFVTEDQRWKHPGDRNTYIR